MNVIYRPVRLINREVIDTFRCIPVREKTDEKKVADKRLLVHEKDILSTATKNAALLSAAFTELSKAFAAGNRYRLIVPINSYSLVSDAGATLIVRAMKELDPSLCSAVIAEFIDLPKSLNLDMLGDLTVPIIPFFDKYLAEPLPISGNDSFTIFSNCNYFGVSLNMEVSQASGQQAIGLLTEFWAEATKSRLKVVVQGVSDQAIVDKAQQYEVFALDGPAIGPDQERLI
jgi:hypothetical protein